MFKHEPRDLLRQGKGRTLREEGRFARGNEDAGQTPVFDKSRTFSTDPSVVLGLSRLTLGGAGRGDGSNARTVFSRRPDDSRPGTPIPWGDPHPDRLAIAEALRAQIEAQEGKWKLTELPATGRAKRGEPRGRGMDKNPRASSSRTPDIAEPLGRYVEPGTVVVIGTRGARALRFATIRDAVVCITGKPATQSGLNAITNAAKGVVRGAYGWTWERVGWAHGKKRGE